MEKETILDLKLNGHWIDEEKEKICVNHHRISAYCDSNPCSCCGYEKECYER